MTLLFLTGNENKIREAKAIIPAIEGFSVDLTEIQSIDAYEIIKHKLLEARKIKQDELQDALIVEDTSLYITGANGLPGPLIKWFEKTIGLNGVKKLADLYGTQATATCLIGYSHKKEIHFFEGTVQGTIVSPRGKDGFGWDKIFVPEGYTRTFAEMTAEEKNEISMRKIAFEKLRDFLECCIA